MIKERVPYWLLSLSFFPRQRKQNRWGLTPSDQKETAMKNGIIVVVTPHFSSLLVFFVISAHTDYRGNWKGKRKRRGRTQTSGIRKEEILTQFMSLRHRKFILSLTSCPFKAFSFEHWRYASWMITMTVSTSTTLVDLTDGTFNSSQAITSATVASPMPLWIQILTLTCMILIDISAFLGNLLVICAFFRTRRLQTVTNYFIASLAFADALVAVFVLPLSIYSYQRGRSWKLGLILCDLWVSSDVLLCTSSILNLTCISLDRYMAITRPLTYTAYRSKFLARVMILLVWIVSAVITCPPIFGWRDSNRRITVRIVTKEKRPFSP